MDLSELTAAPWEANVAFGVVLHANAAIINQDLYAKADDLKFIALARNAFDVMMRRGWGVDRTYSIDGEVSGWFVRLPDWFYPMGDAIFPLANMRRADPFTLLIEADKWYRENVEEPKLRESK